MCYPKINHRKRTSILLTICVLLGIAAAAVGIDDNPPGILLAFLSASAFVTAFVHTWRTSKQFLHLILGSIFGLVVFAVLHNVFDIVASKPGLSGLVPGLLTGASTAFFLVATLLCPSALLVGAVGAVVMYRREHHS